MERIPSQTSATESSGRSAHSRSPVNAVEMVVSDSQKSHPFFSTSSSFGDHSAIGASDNAYMSSAAQFMSLHVQGELSVPARSMDSNTYTNFQTGTPYGPHLPGSQPARMDPTASFNLYSSVDDYMITNQQDGYANAILPLQDQYPRNMNKVNYTAAEALLHFDSTQFDFQGSPPLDPSQGGAPVNAWDRLPMYSSGQNPFEGLSVFGSPSSAQMASIEDELTPTQDSFYTVDSATMSDRSSPSETSQVDSLEDERLQNTYRSDPLYKNVAVEADGLYHCPFEAEALCGHKPDKLKCNYDKFVDSHLKPYRCKHRGCQQARFSSTACQLRHEREAHALHGHGEKPFLCKSAGCDRSVAGSGFPRQWNMRDHMRRVHQVDPGETTPTKGGRKRKSDAEESGPSKKMTPNPVAVIVEVEPSPEEHYGSLIAELDNTIKSLSDPTNREINNNLAKAGNCLQALYKTSQKIQKAPESGRLTSKFSG